MDLPTLIWIAVILAAVLIMLLLPRYGLLAVFRSAKSAGERERIEDALKHMLDQSWEKHPASTSTLKSSLGLSDRDCAARQPHAEPGRSGPMAPTCLTSEGERLQSKLMRHRL
jgi:hypothetical protein